MLSKILAAIGIIDILFSLYLAFAFVGTGELGEAYFSFGKQYLMIGVVQQ